MQEQEIPTINEDVEQTIPVEYDNEPIQGINATIQIGTTTTGEAGTNASVENVGTDTHAILDFTIPRGDKGDKGDKGDNGDTGDSATIEMHATATTLSAGSQATATVTNSGDSHNANYTLALGIPQGVKGDRGERGVQGERGERGEQGIQGIQGIQGETGEAFSIYKTYSSIAEMNADASNVPEGKFTLIASNVDDPDNSKLFVKNGEVTFTYLTDMSGAQGIQGERGEQGIQGIQGIQGVQGETGARGSVKSQYVAELPATGDEDTFYLVDRDLESHTESGEYITLETTQTAGAIQSAQIDGNATQTTYSGKNLLPFTNQDYTLSGVRVYVQDGELYLNGTSTANVSSNASYWKTSFAFTLPAGTYTFGASEYTFTQGEQFFMHKADQTDLGFIKNYTAKTVTFTLEEETSVYLGLFWANGSVFNNKKISITLNAGSTAQPYERYVGGIPAPNPDYPQPISVVTGENTVKVVGKNLWGGLTAFSTSAGGVDFTNNADGSVTASGTATSNTSSVPSTAVAISNNWFITLPSGDYVASAGTLPSGVLLQIYNANTGASLGNAQGQFTLTEQTQVYVRIRVASGTTIDTTFNVQLELGSTATTYQAYTAQDYEVNLGKNLIKPNVTPQQTTNGITLEVKGDGSVAVSGTATANTWFRVSESLDLQVGETYTLSGCPSGGSSTTWQLYTNQVAPQFVDYGEGSTKTITSGAGAVYFIVRAGATIDATFYPQLELGTQATAYAPYFEPLELAKVGTYQDRIYKDGEKWYIEKQTGKITYDGTEAWNVYSAGTVGGDYAYSTATKKFGFDGGNFVPKTDYICDHATQMTYGELVGTTVHSGLGSTQFASYFKVTSAIATTKKDFATWLTSNPTTVYYALATPTTTQITDQTLIDQLEALASASLNQGVNNIWTEIETGNAMPTLELNWVEWEKYNRHNVYIWNDAINDWQIIVGMEGES